MKKICVYADTVKELNEREDDNLAWLTISDTAFKSWMLISGIIDIKKWLSEYTADDTEGLYDFLIANGHDYLAEWQDDYYIKDVFDVDIKWSDEDIKTNLELSEIPYIPRNIRRVADYEFIKEFQTQMTQYGNELIFNRIQEVFKNEI